MTLSEGRDDAMDSNADPRASATDGSAVVAAGRRVGDRISTTVRNSYLYHWLTKVPEPEVIVIDLRETYTIGPIIALLDRLTPYWRESTPKRALDRVAALADRAAETRLGQLLTKLLVPPYPPASDSNTAQPSAAETGGKGEDTDDT